MFLRCFFELNVSAVTMSRLQYNIANCMFCLTKKKDKPEEGSWLETKNVVKKSNASLSY
jgi:hypothetical protein